MAVTVLFIKECVFLRKGRSQVLDGVQNVKFRHVNPNKVFIGNLNTNFISAKLDQLKFLMMDKVDTLLVTETKIYKLFPSSKCFTKSYSPSRRLDRNRNGGGILIYAREDMPSKLLNKHKFPSDFDQLLNLRKWFYLALTISRPKETNITLALLTKRLMYRPPLAVLKGTRGPRSQTPHFW